MFRIILLIFLTLSTSSIVAQFDFNGQCIDAYNAAINLKFDQGRQILEKEKADHPDNLIPLLIHNYIDFLQIVVGEHEQDYKQLKSMKNKRVRQIEKASENSPYYRYSLAIINLQWAMARVKFNDYTRASFEARKAYFLLKANQEEYPGFTPNMIGLGLLHTLIGTIPDQYQWVARLFLLDGSVNGGIDELNQATAMIIDSEYAYLLPECLFFITFLNMNFQPDIVLDEDYRQMLEEQSSDQILLNYAYARSLMKSGQNDQAIDVLLNKPEMDGKYHFYYLDYLLGKAKLNRLDQDASGPFYTYVSNFKGHSFIKASYQKIAWKCLINSDEQGYIDNMGKVIQYGNATVDADKQALMEAERKTLPNVNLLKGRLLFDGGYYFKAENCLKDPNIILVNLKDSVEFNYRLGRIYHAMEKFDKAGKYYKETIRTGSDLPNYYAANAALHLGMIFESKGDFPNARKYYILCLEMDFVEYHSSITQKAKAGVDRVRREE
ncbi:MAG: tetratricopeptide repeat protein [Bacteroidota bacterium]|nr:tetratricopeptide repeat protein [Bacteroidota bacterium]